MTITRRGLITGLISLIAAPAIVRIENLMPVKVTMPNFIILDDYYSRILGPYMQELKDRLERDLLFGGNSSGLLTEYDRSGILNTPIANLEIQQHP